MPFSDLEIHEGWRSLEQCQGGLKDLVFLGTCPNSPQPSEHEKKSQLHRKVYADGLRMPRQLLDQLMG